MNEKPLALAVRMVLFDDHGNILLLKRAKTSKTNPGKWELPGGKMEPGEAFDAALKREVEEETGFTVILHSASGTAMQETDEYRVVNLVMIGTILSGGLSISREHEEYRWIPLPEIEKLEKADWFDEYYAIYLHGMVTAHKAQSKSET